MLGFSNESYAYTQRKWYDAEWNDNTKFSVFFFFVQEQARKGDVRYLLVDDACFSLFCYEEEEENSIFSLRVEFKHSLFIHSIETHANKYIQIQANMSSVHNKIFSTDT